MSEQHANSFLKALRRVTRQVSLYPAGHPLTSEAVEGAAIAAAALTRVDREQILNLSRDSFYLNRVLLPHTSLEHNGLLRELQERGVDSITLLGPVAPGDLFDLAAFAAGTSDDLPAEGTVRLNESRFDQPEHDESPFADLRRSYAGGLDSLRAVSRSMASEGAFDLNPVVVAVEGMLDKTVTQASASLLLATVKSHDDYTFYHSMNTCILALAVGQLLGLDKRELVPIGVGSLLHDIGKVAVDPRILNHPGRLDRGMWAEMKIHPQEGAQAIMAAAGPGHEVAATIALEHHARYDGAGYPHIAHDRRPHVFSMMVTVADVYDAVTTHRPYRRAYPPNRALNLLLDQAGAAYHPDMVRALIRMLGVYPPGSVLRLADGTVAVSTRRVGPGSDDGLWAVRVVDAAGRHVEPEELRVRSSQVVALESPQRVGVDPAALLDRVAVVGQFADEVPDGLRVA